MREVSSDTNFHLIRLKDQSKGIILNWTDYTQDLNPTHQDVAKTILDRAVELATKIKGETREKILARMGLAMVVQIINDQENPETLIYLYDLKTDTCLSRTRKENEKPRYNVWWPDNGELVTKLDSYKDIQEQLDTMAYGTKFKVMAIQKTIDDIAKEFNGLDLI